MCFSKLIWLTCKNHVQVAKIDAIELGQYELYSSRVKDFELSVTLSNVRSASKASSEDGTSRILNSPHWQSVANFTAAKLKGPQTFKLKYVILPQLLSSSHSTFILCHECLKQGPTFSLPKMLILEITALASSCPQGLQCNALSYSL